MSNKVRTDSYIREIDNLFVMSKAQRDEEIQSYLGKYIVVRISGFLEISLRNQLSDYVDNKGSPNVRNYAKWNINQFQNAKTDKIIDFIGRFDPTWQETIENIFSSNDELKEAINSIVGQRHRIVHGDSGGFGLRQCETYWDVIKNGIKNIRSAIK